MEISTDEKRQESLLRKDKDLDSLEFLTLAQAAQLVPSRPSVATIFRWVSLHGGPGKRRLASVRVAGRRMIRRNDLETFLASMNDSEPELISQNEDAATAAATAKVLLGR